jgi:hypothetical protein
VIVRFRRALLVLVILGAGYVGFRWGEVVFPPLERAFAWARERVPEVVPSMEPEPTSALAERALDRFERLRSGQGPDRAAFGSIELSALVRHAFPGIVPPGVDEPTVELSDGRVRLSARVAVDAFPRLPRLEEVAGLLADTVRIRMDGSLVSFEPRYLALVVDRIEASRVPIPSRMIDDVLAGFGRRRPDGAPPHAIAVPLPKGVRSAFVQGDSLVVLAER